MKNDTSKTKIKNALYELLQTKRIEDINVSDISDAANVSRRTFYSNFKDKFDAADEIIKDLYENEIGYHHKNLAACLKKSEGFIDTHRLFLTNTIYYLGQNSLENSYAELLQNTFFQMLDDKNITADEEKRNLCATACCVFSHSLTRLAYIWLTGYKYDSAVVTTPRSPSMTDIEVTKALCPSILTEYFF